MKRHLLGAALLLVGCSMQPNFEMNTANTGIIGGQRATELNPVTKSTVSFAIQDNNSPRSICTGIILSKNLILTAAHCLINFGQDDLFVFQGSSLPDNANADSLIKIKDWVVHQKFSILFDELYLPVGSVNDVALVLLDRNLPETIQPVPLLENINGLRAGDTLTLAGYGVTNESDSNPILKDLYFTQVSLFEITPQYLVTDQRNFKGACQGDSGGPAFIKDQETLIAVGITRGPHDKAVDCHHFGAYTAIPAYKSFIQESAKILKADPPRFVTLPRK